MAAVKAIDFDDCQTPAEVAETLVSELLACPDSDIEIGYPAGVRSVFTSVGQPHEPSETISSCTPASDWVVLATGGARGITAEIVTELARPGMTIIIVGKSPAALEESATVAYGDSSKLRNHFIAESGRNGESVVPAKIEAHVLEVLNDRERRRTSGRLSEAGAHVIYRECDVRQPEQIELLMNWIYQTYGRLDAVLHGAGVIEDKLLADKDWDSFDRVFDTKVDGLFLLARHIIPEKLKMLVLFASVSGRIGNAGQTDYAAANEVLNRMAWRLKSEWPNARVVSINWGPWASSGMAKSAVRAQLQQKGILPIEIEAGRRFFADEIAYGSSQQVEVIAGQGPWSENGMLAEEGVKARTFVARALGR